MSHVCGKASADKKSILKVFNKHVKPGDRSVKRFTADCKCSKHYVKANGHHKIKRLRSRKERSKMRGASTSKSHHQHLHRQSSKDLPLYQNRCHGVCHCPSRRDAPFLNTVPATQEPSIITDSRLIGHHGLFNHEVKSIDIERLLSEQKKREESGEQVQEKSNATSHPSPTSHIPSPLSTNDLLGTEEVLPLEKKTAHDEEKGQKKEKKMSQASDITPAQRPQQHHGLSSESFKSISSWRHSSQDVVMLENKQTNPAVSEEARGSQLTPTALRESVKKPNRKVKRRSPVKHTPKKPCSEIPIRQIPDHDLSPSPLQVSSSLTANSSDIQHRRRDPESVCKSVSAVAASLCDCLQFPLRRRRNLVAESREVLLKALWEQHGPQLQENLREVQLCLSFGFDPANKVQDQEPGAMIKELSPPDVFTTVFQTETDYQPGFNTQKTTSFRMSGRKFFIWKSRPQPQQNLELTPEWLKSPVEPSVNALDGLLRRPCNPEFCVDFEPLSDQLLFPTSCWGERAPASQHWEDSLNRQTGKEPVMFDTFENSFMNITRAVPERSSGSQSSGSIFQPLFPFQTQWPGRCSAEPVHLPPARGSFETDRYSSAHPFSAQIHPPQQGFQPFGPFSHPSACPPLRSHHNHMVDYPPSHLLERDPAAPRSSFPSPEHWSFPPMRLY